MNFYLIQNNNFYLPIKETSHQADKSDKSDPLVLLFKARAQRNNRLVNEAITTYM